MQDILKDLQERVKAAASKSRPLMIRGGGTRFFYGEPLPDEADFDWLDLAAYRGIVSYEPSELVLTARAGTPLSEIEASLDAQGQMLAFEPPRFGTADTLGGCIATALSGPRRMAVGPAADFVLGTRLLDHQGQLLRFGGEVMKNVAGYDVSRLLTGSLGILGALLEVSLKVIPKPFAEQTIILQLGEEQALGQCLAWRSKPLPISGTCWQEDDGGILTVRVSGNEAGVQQALEEIGGERMQEHQATAFWQSLRDQTHDFFNARPLWRTSLPAGAPRLNQGPVLHEWGGCLRWLAGTHDAQQLQTQLAALGGTASLYRQGEAVQSGVFHPLEAVSMKIHQRLKQAMDPAAIFNPGRLYPKL